MNILLISCFYPPQNAIASRRVYAWAKYWSRAGERVTVLTPTKDLTRADLSPQPLEGVVVREVPPLRVFQVLKSFFRRRAQAVGAVTGTVQVSESVVGRSGLRRNVLRWLTSRGLFSSTRMPDAFDLWIWPALRVAREIENETDVVVTTFGPYAPLVVGYFLKRRNPKLMWIIDFRDLWFANHIYAGLPGFRWFERRLERKFVRSCDFLITVSEGLARRLRADHPGADVRVIQNGFDTDDLESLPAGSAFLSDGLKRIVYTGSIHLPTRDPSPLFAAAALLTPEDRRQLRLIFIGPNSALLSKLVLAHGISDVVELRSSIARTEALRAQRDADVLLFLEANYEGEKDGVLTGKLFEYLSSGPPIWGVGIGARSAAGQVIADLQAGVVFEKSVDELKVALELLLRPPPLSASASASPSSERSPAPRPGLTQFRRQNQAEELLRWISEKKIGRSV